MNRTEKQQEIESLRNAFQNAKTAYFLDYRGLTVAQVSDLRRKVRAAKSGYRVVKNRLAIIATKETPLRDMAPLFDGMTAVVWSEADPIALAKVIHDFSKSVPVTIKGGIVEGKHVAPTDIEGISRLPGRPDLVAIFAGMLRSPMVRFVSVLMAPVRDFASVLRQVAEKRETQTG